MSAVLQTFRDKQLGVIFTLPEYRMADKNMRTMGDIIIETIKVNRREQYVECKIFYIQTNPRTSDRYEKYPIIVDENGDKKTITRLRIDKPPEDFIPLYKEKKLAFGEYVNAKAHAAIKKSDGEEEEKEDGKHAQCMKCKYKWVTMSKAVKPMCPSCQSRVTTTNIDNHI